MRFRIVSFNVNGLRSYGKYIEEKNISVNNYIRDHLYATVLCAQESRGSEADLSQFHTLKDYVTFSSLNKKNSGKYGVSTFIKKDFYCSGKDIKLPELQQYDKDGRYILTKHGDFDILNCYFPYVAETVYRSTEDCDKRKVQDAMGFYYSIGRYLERCPKTIVLGDFNAVYSLRDSYLYYREAVRIKSSGSTHNEINKGVFFTSDELKDENSHTKDPLNSTSSKRLQMNQMSHHEPSISETGQDFLSINITYALYEHGRCPNPVVSQTELPFLFENIKYLNNYIFELPNRQWTYKFIQEKGFIDTFRLFSDRNEAYTCWNQMLNLRKINLGTRIDLILIPSFLKHFVTHAGILSNEFGSDHCPVISEFDMVLNKNRKNILTRKNNLLSFFKK